MSLLLAQLGGGGTAYLLKTGATDFSAVSPGASLLYNRKLTIQTTYSIVSPGAAVLHNRKLTVQRDYTVTFGGVGFNKSHRLGLTADVAVTFNNVTLTYSPATPSDNPRFGWYIPVTVNNQTAMSRGAGWDNGVKWETE